MSINKGEALFLVSFNISLYKQIKSIKQFKEIVKNNYIYKYISNLDKGYKFFKYTMNNSYCYLIYTNTVQNYFDFDFLSKYHITYNQRKHKFPGYYAAGTNLYSVLPFML